jgi:hypothetical protein
MPAARPGKTGVIETKPRFRFFLRWYKKRQYAGLTPPMTPGSKNQGDAKDDIISWQ